MRALTIFSEKGGVGKSTVALHLGLGLAEAGWRTVIVDADPSSGLSASVGLAGPGREGFWDAVTAPRRPEAVAAAATLEPNLTIVPCGTVPLRGLDAWEAGLVDGEHFRWLFSGTPLSTADVVVIDTAPGVRGATRGALVASDEALLVVQSEPLSLRTVPRALDALAEIHETGGGARLLGALVTMTSLRSPESLDVLREIWSLFPPELVLEAHVPRDPSILTAQALSRPVAYARRQKPVLARVFEQLAAEVATRLGLESIDDESSPRPFLA